MWFRAGWSIYYSFFAEIWCLLQLETGLIRAVRLSEKAAWRWAVLLSQVIILCGFSTMSAIMSRHFIHYTCKNINKNSFKISRIPLTSCINTQKNFCFTSLPHVSFSSYLNNRAGTDLKQGSCGISAADVPVRNRDVWQLLSVAEGCISWLCCQ